MKENNFCHYPWVGLDITPQGEFRPCCKYESSKLHSSLSEYKESIELAKLKEEFLAGQRPTACNRCWVDEDSGLPSKRQIDFEQIFNSQPPSMSSYKVLSFTFGNSCNLSCRTCSSYSSSSWINDEESLTKKFPQIKVYKHRRFYQDFAFMQSIIDLSDQLIQIDFAGGETFITGISEHLTFLENFIRLGQSNKIGLRYVTNCTTYPKSEFWELWKKFKSVEIQLSIDGTNDQFNYIRYPADWSDVLTNIKRYQQETNIRVTIGHTVSILNVFYIPEFTIWCLKNNFNRPYLGPVETPKYYNIRSLPLTVKDKIAEKLDRFSFKNVVNYMYKEDLSGQFNDFIQMTQEVDKLRNQNFNETFPEFSQLLKEAGCQI